MNWRGEESGAFIGGLAGVVAGEVYGKKTLDAAEPWMLVDALAMIWDWLLGRFEWSPIRLVLAFILGLAYLASPIDIVPDFIPLAGWIGDLLVATAVIRLASADINRWRRWKGRR